MKKRKLEDLNLMDDFLFQEMVSKEGIGEEFCRILLSTILGRPIQKIKVIPQKVLLGIDTGSHGIRMRTGPETILKLPQISMILSLITRMKKKHCLSEPAIMMPLLTRSFWRQAQITAN